VADLLDRDTPVVTETVPKHSPRMDVEPVREVAPKSGESDESNDYFEDEQVAGSESEVG